MANTQTQDSDGGLSARLERAAENSDAVKRVHRYISDDQGSLPAVEDWTATLQAVPELVISARVPLPKSSALVVDYCWLNDGLEWATRVRQLDGTFASFRSTLHGAAGDPDGQINARTHDNSYFAAGATSDGVERGQRVADGGQDEPSNTRRAVLDAIDAHMTETGAPVGDVLEHVLDETPGGLAQVCQTVRRLHANGDIYCPTDKSVKRTACDGGTPAAGPDAVHTHDELLDWTLQIRGKGCSVVENDTIRPTEVTVWTDHDLQIPDGLKVQSKTEADGTAPAVTAEHPDADPNDEVAGQTRYRLTLEDADKHYIGCNNCGDPVPEDDAVHRASEVSEDSADRLASGDAADRLDQIEFNDGPYCSIDCATTTGGCADGE